MVQTLMDAFYEVPDLSRSLITGKYMIPTIVALIIFLFVLFFSNKLAEFLRRIFILADVVLGVTAYFTKQYALIWICAIALAVLALVRLVVHIFVNVRQDRINSKIEERALAKARKRRGSWQSKKGYSGEMKPEEPKPKRKSKLHKSVEKPAVQPEVKTAPAEQPTEQPPVDYMNRAVVMKYVDMLKELKEAGVLTEEEYTTKQAELLSRLG